MYQGHPIRLVPRDGGAVGEWVDDRPLLLRRRGPRIRYSLADFSKHVLSTYPNAKPMDEETYRVPWEGDRAIFLNYDPVNKHAWIAFANEGDEEDAFTHGRNLRRGSLELFRSFGRLLRGFHQARIPITFEADPKKLKSYHPLLTRIGYARTSAESADPTYHPIKKTAEGAVNYRNDEDPTDPQGVSRRRYV